ncbi:MAG: chromosomal replication initiator protein DnaA [Ancalomicrobiaceae bacterium]|nr:chromosomal replication initiator protein DnaA [Ancalomicrobiaceae bacterium]
MTLGRAGQEEWGRVKLRLKAELGEDVFSSWFTRVNLESCDNGVVNLSVPTQFLKNWLQGRYRDRLIRICQDEFDAVRNIEFFVRGAIRPLGMGLGDAEPQNVDMRQINVPPKPVPRVVAPPSASENREAEDVLAGSPLDQRYSFDNFIEGKSNAFALAAARRASDQRPGEPVAFNPLYLQAAVGLGKTHLLQAIAHQARAAGRRVVYLTAEHFMYRFVAALKSQSALAFKDSLRAIDLLLIDDLQFLQGKQIQQEFCHTLNSLIDNARQVVVAADRPPVDLEAVDERVKSRLAGGLLVEIGEPDYDMRRKILNIRVAAAKRAFPTLVVSDAVLDYVAQNVTASGRDLDGAVNRLVHQNQLTGEEISLDMAELALRDLLRGKETRRVKIEDIQRVVSKHYNVSKADMLSARRTQTVVLPRQIAMYLSKTMTPRSLPEIGRRFGNRDHTTVLHAVRKIEALSNADRTMKELLDALKRQIDA